MQHLRSFQGYTLIPELRREALTPEGQSTSTLHHPTTRHRLSIVLKMTDKLPPPLLALFQPRPPLRYLPPTDRAPEDCGKSTISGVAQFLAEAKSFAEEVPYNATESWIQRKYRQKTEKKEQQEKQITDGFKNCTLHLLFFLIYFKIC